MPHGSRTSASAISNPYNNVLPLLKEEYVTSAGQIGLRRNEIKAIGDPDERLGDHLLTFFARGKLRLDHPDDGIAIFFQRASVPLRRQALVTIGRKLRDERKPLAQSVGDRFTELWAWRVQTARSGSPEDAGELEAFGWWFVSGAFDEAWALSELQEVLKLTHIDHHHAVIERLADVSTRRPHEALVCLRYMVEGDREGWVILGSPGDIRVAITNGLNADDAAAWQEAADLVNILVARGHVNFNELLQN